MSVIDRGESSNIHAPKQGLDVPLIPQPDFPSEDLIDGNAEKLTYLFNLDRSSEAQARHLQDYQSQIHLVSTWALKELGVTHYSLGEFKAFTHGFATFEAASDIVRAIPEVSSRLSRRGAYDTLTAGRHVTETLIGDPDYEYDADVPEPVIAAIELRERRIQVGNPLAEIEFEGMLRTWGSERPNTYGLIHDTAPTSYVTPEQISARLMGARVAYQLQLPYETAA